MKQLLFLILLPLLLFGEITRDEIIKQMKAESSLQGEDDVSMTTTEEKNAKRTSSIKYNKDTYRDVAIYRLLKTNEELVDAMAPDNFGRKEEFLANNKEEYEKKKAEFLAEQEKIANQNQQKAEEKIYNISGYCTLLNDVEVDRMQVYSMLDCQFNPNDFNLDASEMFISLHPVYDKLALIGKPIYLRVGDRKIHVDNGIVLTVDQTNLNLADFINDVKIKNLLADMAITTNNIVYTTSMDYLEQKKESDTTEELSTVASPSGTSVVKATNTNAPDFGTYVTIAGIQLLSSFVNTIGTFYKENNYPLFKIKKYKQFYVDFNLKVGDKEQQIDYHIDEYKTLNLNPSRNYVNTLEQN